jgi:hypothetical protein
MNEYSLVGDWWSEQLRQFQAGSERWLLADEGHFALRHGMSVPPSRFLADRVRGVLS